MKLPFLPSVLLFALPYFFAPCLSVQAQQLPLTNIPNGEGYAITENGDVYGRATAAPLVIGNLTKWPLNGAPIDLGAQVVGSYKGVPFFSVNSSATVLSGFGSSFIYENGTRNFVGIRAARGISEDGFFAMAETTSSVEPYFGIHRWTDGQLSQIAKLPNDYKVQVMTLNGKVYGYTSYDNQFIYDNGQYTFFAAPGMLQDASESGSIVISPYFSPWAGNNTGQASLYKNGQLTPFGPVLGRITDETGTTYSVFTNLRINDAGQILGVLEKRFIPPSGDLDSTLTYDLVLWNTSNLNNMIVLDSFIPSEFFDGAPANFTSTIYLPTIHGLTDSGLALLDNGQTTSSKTFLLDISSLADNSGQPTVTPTPTTTPSDGTGIPTPLPTATCTPEPTTSLPPPVSTSTPVVDTEGEPNGGSTPTPTPIKTPNGSANYDKPKIKLNGKGHLKVTCTKVKGTKSQVVLYRTAKLKSRPIKMSSVNTLKPGNYAAHCEYFKKGTKIASSNSTSFRVR